MCGDSSVPSSLFTSNTEMPCKDCLGKGMDFMGGVCENCYGKGQRPINSSFKLLKAMLKETVKSYILEPIRQHLETLGVDFLSQRKVSSHINLETSNEKIASSF